MEEWLKNIPVDKRDGRHAYKAEMKLGDTERVTVCGSFADFVTERTYHVSKVSNDEVFVKFNHKRTQADDWNDALGLVGKI